MSWIGDWSIIFTIHLPLPVRIFFYDFQYWFKCHLYQALSFNIYFGLLIELSLFSHFLYASSNWKPKCFVKDDIWYIPIWEQGVWSTKSVFFNLDFPKVFLLAILFSKWIKEQFCSLFLKRLLTFYQNQAGFRDLL